MRRFQASGEPPAWFLGGFEGRGGGGDGGCGTSQHPTRTPFDECTLDSSLFARYQQTERHCGDRLECAVQRHALHDGEQQLHRGRRAARSAQHAQCCMGQLAPQQLQMPNPHAPSPTIHKHTRKGCSLYKACNATTRSNVGADPTICDPFQQLATICAHDPGMGNMGGCRAHYNSMCANGSLVPQCRRSKGFSNLISTEDSNKWVSWAGSGVVGCGFAAAGA